MKTYDFTLDMKSDNSNSLILRNIKQGSTVLELGPASGRMTKYLKEQLDCQVYIVEKDIESGSIAAKYADMSLLGDDGDLEERHWISKLSNIKFDYVICADVLEHLHGAEFVLRTVTELLKDSGSILISIPNITHNAVIIDLLNDKFTYRDSGILDKTHVKFFSYNSLKNFVAKSGLRIAKETNILNTVDNSEFKNSYNELPIAVSNFLRKREYGEVYQFIWELKKTAIELSIIIPVFNKSAFTASALKDLSNLDASKVEIIIVDNASTDNTSEVLVQMKREMSNLIVVQNDENLGFGRASNKAFTIARGSHIMFLNNDIRVQKDHKDWINIILKECSDNNLVGPTAGKVDKNNDFNFLYETNDASKDINYMSGWCLTAKKSVWEKLIDPNNTFKGPFSEAYFCYFEDTHASFTAANLGIEFKLITIPVHHFGKVSSSQLNTYSLYKKSKEIFSKNWNKR